MATTLLVLGGLGLALMVSNRPAGLGAAALVGTFAGATWLPCVGAELGTVLTDAQNEPASAILPMGVYLVGVMIPLVAIMALLAYVSGDPPVGGRPVGGDSRKGCDSRGGGHGALRLLRLGSLHAGPLVGSLRDSFHRISPRVLDAPSGVV